MASTLGRYITDPSSPAKGPVLPRGLFDPRPHRNRGMPQIPNEIPAMPDSRLIATLVAHGQPRWAAEEVRRHPVARFSALKFWCDVQDAAEGDHQAQERVDYCRECWEKMRVEGLISDVPNQAEPLA